MFFVQGSNLTRILLQIFRCFIAESAWKPRLTESHILLWKNKLFLPFTTFAQLHFISGSLSNQILLIPAKTTATDSTPSPPSAHLSLIHISISSLLFLAGGHYRGEGLPTDNALSLFPWHHRDETDPVTALLLFLSLLLLVTHCAPVSPTQRALSTVFCNIRQQRKT